MKRSSNIRLTLMAAAVPVALAGCQSEPTGQVLSSSWDCGIQSDVDPAQCEAAYNKALADHPNVAPRFDNGVDCRDQFGQCTAIENEQGQTSWIPPMGGFLLGYALSNAMHRPAGQRGDCARYPEQPKCRSGGYRAIVGSSPLYRDYRSGDYLKPSGDYAATRTGPVTGSRGNASLPARAVTVSRSGFGASSASRGSFGGGRGFGG